MRNAGEEVTLTVSFLKKTPAFLKLPLCEDCTCTCILQTSKEISELKLYVIFSKDMMREKNTRLEKKTPSTHGIYDDSCIDYYLSLV